MIAADAPGAPGAPPPPLRRNHRFQFLWAGAAFSTLGTEINRLALPLTLLTLTGNPTYAGLVAAALTASMLIAQMPAGVWVDRHDRRRILLVAQAIQLLNALALLLGLALGEAGVTNFFAFAIIDGVCRAFLGPAREVAIRAIVPVTQLRLAFAQEESRSHAGRVLGPALGGTLYAAGTLFPYLATTVSLAFAWAFAALGKVPRQAAVTADVPGPGASARKHGMLGESVDALRWLIHQKGLRELSAVLMAMNCLGGAFTIPLIVHIHSLGGSDSLTGLVLAGIGIGGLLGALSSAWVTGHVPAGRLAILVPAIFGGCLVLASLTLAPWWPFIPILMFSLVTPALNVASGTVTAQLVPADMLGRVGSLLTLTGFLLAPLGLFLGGYLSSHVGGGWTLCLVGAGLLLTAAVAAISPTLRKFRADHACRIER